MENIYFYALIAIVGAFFLIDSFISYLNAKNWSEVLPNEAKEIYDEEKYQKSQSYEKQKYKFSKIS